MKNLIFTMGWLFFCTSLSYANSNLLVEDTLKVQHPYEGRKAIMINVDPLIGFVGNLFNGASYNNIRLHTAGLVYRRYLPDHRVKRMTLNANFRSIILDRQINSFSVLDDGFRKVNDFGLGFTVGKEKHFVQNKFSLYYGHDFLMSVSYDDLVHKYDYQNGDIINEDVFSSTYSRRETLELRNIGASLGFAGIFGVDYMLSKRIFLNAEVRIPVVATYNYNQRTRYEEVLVDFESRQVTTVPMTNRPDIHLFTFDLSTTQFFQFRAGFVF
jgi:hypothetical protein